MVKELGWKSGGRKGVENSPMKGNKKRGRMYLR
jgi:hypothetical protein